jgi:hypothetical protein
VVMGIIEPMETGGVRGCVVVKNFRNAHVHSLHQLECRSLHAVRRGGWDVRVCQSL